MTIDPARDSLALLGLLQGDRLLMDCVESSKLDIDFSVVTASLLQLADGFDLDDEQRGQMAAILESEAPNIGVLVGQIIKSRRRLLAARHSPIFNQDHERTLIAEQLCLLDELNYAGSRLRLRILNLLASDREDNHLGPARTGLTVEKT